jgi:hypothetical protein
VSAYDWLFSLAAQPLGFVLAPLAAGAWGAEVPLTVAAVLTAAGFLATALVPSVRALNNSPEYLSNPMPVHASR